MAYITRNYDDSELLQRILERKPDLNFGDAHVEVDEVELTIENAAPVAVLKVHVRLSPDDLTYVLANPRR